MQIKKIILSVIFIFTFLPVFGQDVKKCIVLSKNDQSTVLFPLYDNPKITFSDNFYSPEVSIESSSGSITIWSWDINKIEIREVSEPVEPDDPENPDDPDNPDNPDDPDNPDNPDDPDNPDETGINDITDNSGITFSGKEIYVESALPQLPFSIFNLGGVSVKSGSLPVGFSSISLSDLQPGIYIAKIAVHTLKISIK